MNESPLSRYFLSREYKSGEDFVDEGYSLDQEEKTFVHKNTNIKVWSFALDKRPAGREQDWTVLYHYTSKIGFDLITDISKQEKVQLFASKEAKKDCHFGPGLYATSKAPDQWQRQEDVLMNNYHPTQANWKKEKPHAKEAPKWMGRELEAYVTKHHDGKAAYCIAVLCDKQAVIDAMKESTKPPALQVLRPAGYDVHGTRQPPERDVWIISDWSFKTDKPVVEDFMQKREEIALIILRRLRLKLDKVAAALSDFSAAGEICELLHLLNKEGPVRWSRLRELCIVLEIPISSMVKMMADAEADESNSSDLANQNAVGSVLPTEVAGKTITTQAHGYPSTSSAQASPAQAEADAAAAAKYPDQGNDPAICQAACCGDLAAVRHFVRLGPDALQRTSNRWETALHQAARKGHTEVVRVLLEAKASVEAKNSHSSQPLHLAAQYGHVAVVRLFLAANAPLEPQDGDGDGPLHCAAGGGALDVVQQLVAARARLNVVRKNGQTPLQWAESTGHHEVVQFLRSAACQTSASRTSAASQTWACCVS